MINYNDMTKQNGTGWFAMTLKTISGYRNTSEAKGVEQQIEFRANGAALFANEPAAPRVTSPTSPAL